MTIKSDTAGDSLTYAFDTAKRAISVTQTAPTFVGTRANIWGHDIYSPPLSARLQQRRLICILRCRLASRRTAAEQAL